MGLSPAADPRDTCFCLLPAQSYPLKTLVRSGIPRALEVFLWFLSLGIEYFH